MCMTQYELRKSRANSAMWLIRSYYRDLSEFYAGDDARFSRMVVDGGRTLATAHPDGWTQHIVNCTSAEALEFHWDELQAIYAKLRGWGHDVTLPGEATE